MAITRTFTREYLRDELGLPWSASPGTVISDRITDARRWSSTNELIFRLPDQATWDAWLVEYSIGSKQMHGDYPWDNEPTVTATLVRQVERLVKVWEPAQ